MRVTLVTLVTLENSNGLLHRSRNRSRAGCEDCRCSPDGYGVAVRRPGRRGVGLASIAQPLGSALVSVVDGFEDGRHSVSLPPVGNAPVPAAAVPVRTGRAAGEASGHLRYI